MWSAKMCKNGGSSDIFHNFWMVSNTDRDFGWKIKDVVDLVEEMSPSFTLPGVLDEVLNVMDSHKTHGGVQNVALFLLRTILKDWAAGLDP